MTGVGPTGQILNKNVGWTPEDDYHNARPSSNHSGGFIATMADGSSRFISEDIEYRVYCLLMSPDSANCHDPKYNYTSPNYATPTFTYPAKWYTGGIAGNPLIPVTDPDIFYARESSRHALGISFRYAKKQG